MLSARNDGASAAPAAPRPRPPTAAPARSASRASTWTQTMSAGSLSSYWTLPTSPWAAISTPSTVSGSSARSEAPRRRRSSHTAITATPNSAAIVACRWTTHVQRVGALEVQPVDLCAGEPRRSGARRPSRRCRRRSSAPRAAPARAPTRPSAGRSSAAASPARTCARHASATAAISTIIDSPKWAITNPGARCSRTVNPPSTACATTPSGSVSASQRQVAAERTAGERQHGGDHHGQNPDEPRDRPVAELDQRMRAERRQRLAVAPAASPGSRAPSRSAARRRRSARSASARRA